MSPIDPRLIAALRTADHVVVFTGAGVSAESGLPTFRDRQEGLWARFNPGDLATPGAFERDPSLVWGWYEWRRAAVLAAQPNAAHRAIAALAPRVAHLTVITQNVDDLHERAGSREVVHLHGELFSSRCAACRRPYQESADPARRPTGPERIEPPRCASCGARVRPGVVWFGEPLPAEAWRRAREAVEASDVFICCGTSSRVQPAASLTDVAIACGALTVQVDPNPTGREDEVTVALRGPAGTVLPQILAETWAS